MKEILHNSKSATLREIAQSAGVSSQAVSLVMRGKDAGQVSAEKAQKIRRIAQELGFQGNYHARRIRSGKSETINLILDDLLFPSNQYYDFQGDNAFSRVLSGVVSAAAEAGYDIRILPQKSNEQEMIASLKDKMGYPYFDGILFYGCHYLRNLYPTFRENNIPCQGILRLMTSIPPFPYVGLDYAAGCRMLLSRMKKEYGIRHLVFSTISLEHRGYQERQETLYRAAAEILPEDRPETIVSDNIPKLRREAAAFLRRWKKAGAHPAAVVCYSARLAGLWQYELEWGGVEDGIFPASLEDAPAYPELPCLQWPLPELGETAVRYLIHSIRGEKTDGTTPVFLPPVLNMPEKQ